MENKYVRYLIWFLIISVICGLFWFVVHPIVNGGDMSEFRLYARLFLILYAVNTFAVLRLYNSIVQNTRFAIKLREESIKLQKAIPNIVRETKKLSAAIGNLKNSISEFNSRRNNN